MDNEGGGIYIFLEGKGTISGNVISGNGYSGIEIKDKSDPQIVYNTIVVNKGDGVWVYIDAAPVISNNIIVKNGDDGIDIRGHDYGSDGNPQVSYNNVWGNGMGNYEGMEQPDTDISVDPLFVDLENGDYHLQSNSPCLGKSDNGNDLGAYQVSRYTITASAGPNGTISPSGEVKVSPGSDQTFTITPAKGYQVADVKVDGVSTGAWASYTFVSIQSNHTIEASFTAQVPYIKGDINSDGAVRSNDAILTLRIAAGLMEPTDYQEQAADMNGDGRIRSNDAILILRKAAGLAAPGRNSVAGRGQITMSLDEVRGISGETVEVSLRANRAIELGGGDLHIAYNSEVLRLDGVSHEPGILLADHVAGPGILRIAFASIDGLSSKIVARLKFHILTDDVSSLRFQKTEFYSTNAVPINSRLLDGEFRSWAMPADHNALLQNFPNPSNPDTWIPYQLKVGANVVIKIYTVTGEIVRILDLGYKSAGFYTGKGRAAYWDGMNESGENVSSGIYFYTMQAGEFAVTKKMVVAK